MNMLFTPARIGPVEIKNRIVMPPMTTRTSDAEGFVTDDSIAYYMARVRGGTGLITVEMASPEKCGRHRRHEIGIYDDRFLPGLTRLVGEIHRGGAKASIQLGHGGGHTRADICGETPIAPSAIPHPVYETTFETIVPEAMTKARIAETIAAHVAAGTAGQGGRLRLRRNPRRARLSDLAISCAVRKSPHRRVWRLSRKPRPLRPGDFARREGGAAGCGRHLPALGRRLFPGGLTFEEGRQIAVWAALGGADALHITAGHYRSLPSAQVVLPPMSMPDGPFLDYAAEVKKQVNVPVIAVGRLGDPKLAESAVSGGKADFIALGRTLVADPQWAAKVERGEPVRRCLACNTCINEMRGGARIGCVVNGAAGRETVFAGARPPHGERIAVIGAGPAGLTYASLVADDNTVTVFERDAVAGGSFRYAGKAPLFQEVTANEASFRALHRRHGRRLRAEKGRVPLRDRCERFAAAIGRVRPHRHCIRRRLPLRPRAARHPGARRAASRACPASHGCSRPTSCATGFTTARGAAAATPLRRWPGRDKRSRSSATLSAPARASKPSQAHSKRLLLQALAGGMSRSKMQEPSCRQSFIPDVAFARNRAIAGIVLAI